MFAGLAAAIIVSVTRGRRSGVAPALAPGLEDGVLTLTGVTERPLDADKDGRAFATVSGQITGPSIPPTQVYRRLVLEFGSPWPEVGQQWPVFYKVGKVDSTWNPGRLSAPEGPDSGVGY